MTPAGDDEGWRWASYRHATHPSFWVADDHPDMARFHGGAPGLPYQKDDGSHCPVAPRAVAHATQQPQLAQLGEGGQAEGADRESYSATTLPL